MVPTIGRRVYFFPGPSGLWSHAWSVGRDGDPFDAGIVFVNDDGTVNLSVTDHAGHQAPEFNVQLVRPGEVPADLRHAEWMPYQVQTRNYGA